MKQFTREMARQVIKPRPSISHKGNFGRVLIIAGDANFGGAAIMSATAAVYAGVGLTTVATDASNWSALHARLPEAMVTDWQPATLMPLIHTADVVVVGPGLGTSVPAQNVLTLCLREINDKQTLIIDGSAIDIIADTDLSAVHGQIIWTPHQMEWARLSGIPIAEQTPANAVSARNKLADNILVLKGAPTRTYGKDVSFENTTGSPAMATGGSGDTLTGIIAAFCAQFGTCTQTVAAAVWLHSSAADSVAKENYVALPTAVAQRIPSLMHTISTQQTPRTIGF